MHVRVSGLMIPHALQMGASGPGIPILWRAVLGKFSSRKYTRTGVDGAHCLTPLGRLHADHGFARGGAGVVRRRSRNFPCCALQLGAPGHGFSPLNMASFPNLIFLAGRDQLTSFFIFPGAGAGPVALDLLPAAGPDA